MLLRLSRLKTSASQTLAFLWDREVKKKKEEEKGDY
jgi:hypothetical protein